MKSAGTGAPRGRHSFRVSVESAVGHASAFCDAAADVRKRRAEGGASLAVVHPCKRSERSSASFPARGVSMPTVSISGFRQLRAVIEPSFRADRALSNAAAPMALLVAGPAFAA